MSEKINFDDSQTVFNIGSQIKIPKDVSFEELREFMCDMEFTVQGELESKYRKWQITEGDKC